MSHIEQIVQDQPEQTIAQIKLSDKTDSTILVKYDKNKMSLSCFFLNKTEDEVHGAS
jgi:hypothetical protein